MKNGSCRDEAQNNNCYPDSPPQERKWPLVVLAPSRCNHEAEHPVQSPNKICAGKMAQSLNGNWSYVLLSLLGIFAVLDVNSQNTYKALY